jgi:hypothetical protein
MNLLARYELVMLVVSIVSFLPQVASAQTGGAPAGSWYGRHADGSGSITFVLQRDGTCLYAPSGATPVVGRAYWKQTSPAGGIVTIRYSNGRFENNLYYSITWVNQDTVVLSDPYFRVTLKRQ